MSKNRIIEKKRREIVLRRKQAFGQWERAYALYLEKKLSREEVSFAMQLLNNIDREITQLSSVDFPNLTKEAFYV